MTNTTRDDTLWMCPSYQRENQPEQRAQMSVSFRKCFLTDLPGAASESIAGVHRGLILLALAAGGSP